MKKLIELDRKDMPQEYLELLAKQAPKFEQFILNYGLFNVGIGKVISSKIELYKILSSEYLKKERVKEIAVQYAGKEVYYANGIFVFPIYTEDGSFLSLPKEAFEK